MNPGIWNDALIEELKRLVAEGRSGGQIAAVIGCSRNAVIGKVKRIGLTLAGQPAAPAKTRRAGARIVAAKEDRAAELPEARARLAAIAAGHARPVAPVPFLTAVEEGRCLFFAGEALGPSGPDMPVCGRPRDPDAPHLNRYCRHHNLRLRGAGRAELDACHARRAA